MGRARTRRGLIGAALGFACLIIQLPARAQTADDAGRAGDSVCEQAGRAAERGYALPAGILLAIGRVESGRWDAARGRVVPWPWAIDANGSGQLFDTKDEAVLRTTTLRAGGMPNVDVGCFQIDLTSHPHAFADLQQAFDPVSNADYAGRFLASLFMRTGSWDDAVAAYHSMIPERGSAYRQRVFTEWALKDPATPMRARGPLVVEFASGARMRIWTPGATETAADPGAPALPRVQIGRPSLR